MSYGKSYGKCRVKSKVLNISIITGCANEINSPVKEKFQIKNFKLLCSL